MKKFRFIGFKDMKLDKWKAIPNTFTFDDIDDDTFPKSTLRRMKSAKDGLKIPLRTHLHRYELALLVIDADAKKIKKKKIDGLKRQVKSILKDKSVIRYRSLLKKLGLNCVPLL